MSEVPKERRPFKQLIMDLLLQNKVTAESARAVAVEVIEKSTMDTPMETIRSMIVDSLEKRNQAAAKRLAERFAKIKQYLSIQSGDSPESTADEIYDEETRDQLLDDDEITAAEAFFMEGREGHLWLRKERHRDTKSVELAEEDYFDD